VKKVMLSILTFLYLMLSTGIAMEVHYCMGKKIGTDFFHDCDGYCGRCGMEEKDDGCCRDEIKFYKYTENFSTPKISVPQAFYLNDIVGTCIPEIQFQWIRPQSVKITSAAIEDTGPPLRIRYCTYRL
jgi:hypothetical protein